MDVEILARIQFAFTIVYVLNKKIKKGPYDESKIGDRPLQEGIAKAVS
jgi:cytochrome d ubiquinol oxidase subunit I